MKHTGEELTVHEMYVPLRVRAHRSLRDTDGLSAVVDWEAICDYLSFQFPRNHIPRLLAVALTRSVSSGNAFEALQDKQMLADAILYTTYKHNLYSFLSIITDVTPQHLIPGQTKTYLSSFSLIPDSSTASVASPKNASSSTQNSPCCASMQCPQIFK